MTGQTLTQTPHFTHLPYSITGFGIIIANNLFIIGNALNFIKLLPIPILLCGFLKSLTLTLSILSPTISIFSLFENPSLNPIFIVGIKL